MALNTYKEQGVVQTPHHIVKRLVEWAVKSPRDKVIDAGCGQGVFLFEAYQRLISLGAEPADAVRQLYGVELDENLYAHFQTSFKSLTGLMAPNVTSGNLFDAQFPQVDALVGNPPYVRRWWLDNLEAIREKMPVHLQQNFTRLTDLACYFVVYTAQYLKPTGRLAMILTDSWLNMDYGVPFKRFLLNWFNIRGILGFQGRIFDDVLIRAVLLLAERREKPLGSVSRLHVTFVKVNGSPPQIPELERCLTSGSEHLNIISSEVEVVPESPWGVYLQSPSIYFRIAKSPLVKPLGYLAHTRIGLQTFAKSFYILSSEDTNKWGLDSQYLRPMIFSPRDLPGPVIEEAMTPCMFVLYCDKHLSELEGQAMSSYIKYWASQEMKPRGKKKMVIGVGNLPRVGRARRKPWYNLVPEIDRRGGYPILFPRRTENQFTVTWNKAGWIPGENFIEVRPRLGVSLKALLAVLCSSAFELAFRVNAHLYGGGVFNINPGDVWRLPVIDLHQLSPDQVRRLEETYDEFLRSDRRFRDALDTAIVDILGMPRDTVAEIQEGLQEMQKLSSTVRNKSLC